MSVIWLDVETSGLNPWADDLYLIAYAVDDGEIKVVDVDNGEDDEYLRQLLSNPDNILAGHNIKFDALYLCSHGFTVAAKLDDTRILAYLNYPFEEHGLKALVENKLRREVVRMEDFAIKPKKKELPQYEGNPKYLFIDKKYYDRETLKTYNKADVDNCRTLKKKALTESDWYKTCEQPLTMALHRAEVHGITLNQSHLVDLRIEFEERLGSLKSQLPEGFNPGSPKQVSEFFGKKYDLDVIAERTNAGGYRCDKMFLKNLAWNGDADAKVLLEIRKLSKLQNTYVEPLLEASKIDGRVHGLFNQAGRESNADDTQGTATGRLTSVNPNLQQIPARTEEGKRIRRAFTASVGTRMFDADLKQIEPRLVANYSQAVKLVNAFNKGLDTHGMFGADIFDKPVEALTKNERFIGKTSWLATFYGCSYKKLLWTCEVNSEDPLVLDYKPYINDFQLLNPQQKGKIIKEYKGFDPIEVRYAKWMYFKNVQDSFKRANKDLFYYRQAHIDRTKHNGYIKTIGGRTIKIEGLDSPMIRIRMAAERLAVNYQIQASAAEMMKLILVRYDREIVQTGKGVLLASVHDEVLGEIKEDLADDKTMAHIKDIMCNTMPLRGVPIDTDAHWMNNWSEK